MHRFRGSAPGLAAVLCALTIATGPGCGTNAVGVESCRDIETARCEAASHCPSTIFVSDVEACKRFYRDQCLHGLSIEDKPGSGQVTACVDVLQAAGRCAAADPDQSPADCGLLADDLPTLETVCTVVQYPERISECSFLTEPVAPPTATGGSAGQSGASGAGGVAGASE